ncbi:hypothetical protein Q1695_012520 [Nippostrongylus brasiliensis]|nr:hypothetical protein Q1695_012520 [Nippostrongylus brasiliensis]
MLVDNQPSTRWVFLSLFVLNARERYDGNGDCVREKSTFLVLACDGLWKSFDNDEVINYVNELLEKSSKGMDEKEIWQKMADDLAAEAVRRRCGDNVSVILMRIHK